MQEIHAGSSFGSTNDHRAHFGLGAHNKIDSVRVEWPGGCKQTVSNSAMAQIDDINESGCTQRTIIYGVVGTTDNLPLDNIQIRITDNQGGEWSPATDCYGVDRVALDSNVYYVQPVTTSYTYNPNGSLFTLNHGDEHILDIIASPS